MKNSEKLTSTNIELLTFFGLDIDNLIVVNSNDSNEISTFRPNGCYAHGELEVQFGYDICNFLLSRQPAEADQNISFHQIGNMLPDGIYECKTESGQECLWYLWSMITSNFSKTMRGLIILKSDESSKKYCEDMFKEKPFSI